MANNSEGNVPTQSFAAGSVIFSEGEPGLFMYVVKAGEVDLVVNGRIVETLGPEEFFGEMALVEKASRSATAVAKTDCKLASISERQFLFMVQENPFFSLRIMKTLSRRLRQLDKLL